MAPEFGASMTPDGRALYFNRASADRRELGIMVARRTVAGWSTPRIAPFSGTHRDLDAFVSPDGDRLCFNSDRPDGGGGTTGFDVWYVERTDGAWGKPVRPPPPINSGHMDLAPGVDPADGSLLFTSERPGLAGTQPDSVRPPGDLYRSSLRPADLCRAKTRSREAP